MRQGLTMQELRGELPDVISAETISTETISALPQQKASERSDLIADLESKRTCKETEITARVRPVASAVLPVPVSCF